MTDIDIQDQQRLLWLGADEGQALWFGANRITIKATANDTDGDYAAWVSWAPPGSSPPLHLHRGVDESFWIASGTVRFRVADQERTLGPGGFVLLPREVPHTFIVEGDEEAVMFGMFNPGGSEGYFAAAGRPAQDAGLPPAGPPDIARFQQAGAEYRIEIVGPPLTPSPRRPSADDEA